MQPEFSETLSAILESVDRLGNSPELSPKMRMELQNVRSLSSELAIYYQETASEVKNLRHQLAQITPPSLALNPSISLQHSFQSEDECYVLLALIFARLKLSIDLEELLDTIALEVFQLLQVDQVIVYPLGKLNHPSNADDLVIKHEAVKDPNRSLLNQPLPSLYRSPAWLENCQNNISCAINNIDDPNNIDPQVALTLQPMGINSAIAVAIPYGRETWGLILIHQYDTPRHWQAWEIDLLEKLATQLAIFIHQMQLLEKSEGVKRERDQVIAKLQHSQLHDSLTGLLNRNAFMTSLETAFKRSQRDPNHNFAVLFIDCDRLQSINENFSIAIGDQILQGISQRLLLHQQPHVIIARINSDEFAILIENLDHADTALKISSEILSSIKQPFVVNQQQIFTSVSIGIALKDHQHIYSNEVLRDACLAMHQSRKIGRGKQTLFDRQDEQDAKSAVQLENDLRQALTNQELYLVYQPIVSVHQHQVTGFEVLLRWMHPLQGLISPVEFLPIAEETGEIVAIGEWVLEKACQQLSVWQKLNNNYLELTLSINVSTMQVTQPNFVDRVRQIIHDQQISPHSIKLEVTESVFIQNIDIAAQKLAELREIGIQIYIDDFGTGYSSFSYLQNLPIDVLKIDRSFTNKIISDVKSKRIIQAILRLANNLGMGIVVEGIETAEELDYFENVGGASISVQGFLISHPLDSDKATTWLENQL
jgi:diguanylate cyclase (GGDEF)-like protein